MHGCATAPVPSTLYVVEMNTTSRRGGLAVCTPDSCRALAKQVSMGACSYILVDKINWTDVISTNVEEVGWRTAFVGNSRGTATGFARALKTENYCRPHKLLLQKFAEHHSIW